MSDNDNAPNNAGGTAEGAGAGKEKKRPNANYPLTNKKVNPDEIVYHYNREKRLEKAAQRVRDLYKEQKPKRFTLFRSLTDSKPKIMLLITIVVTCIMIFVLSLLGFTGNPNKLDGNQIAATATNHDGAVIVALKKTIPKNIFTFFNSPYTGAVDITVMPAELFGRDQFIRPEDIFYHRVFFTLESNENYNFAVPFVPGDLTLILQTEEKTLRITVKPE